MTQLTRRLIRGVFVTSALAMWLSSAQAINIDFAAISGGQIQFVGSGNTFSFQPGSGNQFQITGSDGIGDSEGLYGRMNGAFTIGSITTIGPVQTAPVTGSGLLIIHDGSGYNLTGNLMWDSISTFGPGGTINVNGVLNLSSLTYVGGTSPVGDLVALAAFPHTGSEVVSFQFASPKSLTQLTEDTKIFVSSFSGSFSKETVAASLVPDAGSTLALFGLSLTGLWVFRRKKA